MASAIRHASTAAQKFSLTLAVFKPSTANCLVTVDAMTDAILDRGFYVVQRKHTQLSAEKAGQFYGEHKGKKFYDNLIAYMTSGPVYALALAHRDAIKEWRDLIGPTAVLKTWYLKPDSLRGLYGLSNTRNGTHGSDAPATARREIGFYFPEFDQDAWYAREEPYFREGLVNYDEEYEVHRVRPNAKLPQG